MTISERENFYRWIDSCPLTDFKLSEATSNTVSYEFKFNSPEPSEEYIDKLYSYVLPDLSN
jgi:hypothetical protein